MTRFDCALLVVGMAAWASCQPRARSFVGKVDSKRRAAPRLQGLAQCVSSRKLPSWACLPIRRKALRTLKPAGQRVVVALNGRRVALLGRVVQRAPIRWRSGGGTQVDVTVQGHHHWVRGQASASKLRILLRKGTRLYAGPGRAQVGILTGDLEVVPRTYERGHVSFEYETPSPSRSHGGVLLWAKAARFRHDARAVTIPVGWKRAGGKQLPKSMWRRLGDQLSVFVEGRSAAETSVPICGGQLPKTWLLRRRRNAIQVMLRLESAYSGRPAPVLLRGWIYLEPRRKKNQAQKGFRVYCARRMRRAPLRRGYAGRNHVTTLELPLYTRTGAGAAPVGVLAAGAGVDIQRARLVRKGRRRYLRVSRGGPYYVPYAPHFFRRAATNNRERSLGSARVLPHWRLPRSGAGLPPG